MSRTPRKRRVNWVEDFPFLQMKVDGSDRGVISRTVGPSREIYNRLRSIINTIFLFLLLSLLLLLNILIIPIINEKHLQCKTQSTKLRNREDWEGCLGSFRNSSVWGKGWGTRSILPWLRVPRTTDVVRSIDHSSLQPKCGSSELRVWVVGTILRRSFTSVVRTFQRFLVPRIL